MIIISILLACRENFPEKCRKVSSKMFKHSVQQKVQHSVQQKVQQKVRSVHNILFTRPYLFTKVLYLFFAFISQLKVYCASYIALSCAIVKQHVVRTAMIFRYHINLILINDAPLFKVITFDVALFDVALLLLHYLMLDCLMLNYFEIVLFDASLFLCCAT